MRIVTTIEPAVEPVTVELAKQHARVDISDDDDLIAMYIKSARRYCERYCDISFITQTKAIYYDYSNLNYAADYIPLPIGPIQSITSYTTYANNNTGTVVDSEDYYLAGINLAFNDSYIWPDDLRGLDAYKILAVVGFGDDPEDVPEEIREAILRLVAHTYQNREAIYDSVNGTFNNNVPHSVTALLAPYKDYSI